MRRDIHTYIHTYIQTAVIDGRLPSTLLHAIIAEIPRIAPRSELIRMKVMYCDIVSGNLKPMRSKKLFVE